MVNNELINKAIEYIFEHIDEKLTVDEVAQHCHMSKYHFSRLFMAAYNAVILKVAGVSGVAAFAVVGYTSYLVQMIMIGIGQ